MSSLLLRSTYYLTAIAGITALCGLTACGGSPDPENGPSVQKEHVPLFLAVPADRSGIHFSNTLSESPILNFYTYEYAYNGGGVAVGDVNNDGLADIYFTGNQVSDRLYLNKGGSRFEDVTEKAIGHTAGEGWRTGVAMADVNADGWLDIYVCRGGPSHDTALTRNLLYQNNGDGSFSERAREYGIADTTHSTQAAFADFDGDADLDLFVINTPADRIMHMSGQIEIDALKARTAPSSRLYRNNGGRFSDITYAAGVQSFLYALGLSTADMDQDGRPDIYIASDFDTPDLMLVNQGELKFTNELQTRLRHISNFGMGCDVADFNNDALADIMVLDMVADDHARNKTNMGSMSPERFWNNVFGGRFFQYMVNTLQLNNGNGSWSEIAQLAGVARTDWSWAPLFCDLDNDGWKDLLVTNGFKHDVRNNDYNAKVYEQLQSGLEFYQKLDLIPSTKLHNYLFRNNGADASGLTFSDSSKAWGFTRSVNSNGAAYADLDNDGDLDLVINHLDDPASLYENTSDRRENTHWLRLDLRDGSHHALGARAYARVKGGVQYQELAPVRGYQSCMEPVLHFGLGTAEMVDSLEIEWPDGAYTLRTNVKADQLLTLQRAEAGAKPSARAEPEPLFEEVALARGLDRRHRENGYNDFELEPLLPHKQSEHGPLLGVGDANGDGRDDLFAGGAHGQSGILWLQKEDGTFSVASSQPWKAHSEQETLGSVFFDADGDGDNDLLVLAGSSENDIRDPIFTQRLYANDGRGGFRYAEGALPPMITSAMRADAADIDGDGDQDLYIGGRNTPGHYPFAPRSYLLVNDGLGRFVDGTKQLAPDAMGPGLITSVEFADVDGDRDPDLLLTGEWMSLMLLRNDRGRFVNATATAGLDSTHGWWYSLATADVNGDGRLDLIGGNLGWNSKFHGTPENPVHIYWADFDDDGRSDIVLAKEKLGHQLPVRGRQCSSQQCPMIEEKFPTYEAFAKADLDDIYTAEKLGKALHLKATFMRSAVFLQDERGRFTPRVLPELAQAAPINAIVPLDVDGDGDLDLVTGGNNWGAEVETVHYDAGTGLVLKNDGRGNFRPMTIARSGFFAWANAKDMALLRTGPRKEPLIVVANNNEVIQAFQPRRPTTALSALEPR